MWTSFIVGILLLALGVWGIWQLLEPLADDASRPPGPGLSPVEFPEQTLVIAKDQPQYRPLPAFVGDNVQGSVITCWQLTGWDRVKLLLTGRLWCCIWTFKQPLQPLYFSVWKSDVLRPLGGPVEPEPEAVV